MENMMGLIMKIYLAIDVVIFLVLFVIYFFLSGIFQGLAVEELEKLKVLYAIAGLFSILSFVFQPMNGAMMAYEYFVPNKIFGMVHRVGMVFLIVICLMFNSGVYALVLVNGLVGFGISLAKFFYFIKKSKIRVNWLFFDRVEMNSLFSFSVWVFVSTLAQRFRLTFMPSLLGIFSNSTQISIFALGMQIEGMVWILSTALNGLFLPKVTRLNYNGDSQAISSLMIRVGRIQLFIISFILFGFIIIGHSFIHLWVGDFFYDSYIVVILLTGFNIVSLTQHIASDLVYAENKVRYTSTLTFVSSGVALLGSVLLAPQYGAIGCALSYFVAMTINLIQLNVFYKKKLNIEVGRFFRECHLRIIPFLAVLGIIFFFFATMVRLEHWQSLIAFACIYSLCYAFVSYRFLFNSEEKSLVCQVCSKIRKK